MLFGLMAFFAKLATVRLSGAQVATIRFLIGIVPVLVIPKFRRASMTFQRADLLFYRGFFGGIAVLLFFTAIEHIPVGVATLLNYTTPLFSGVAAAVFIGERLRLRVMAPLIIAFAGVFLVVKSHITPDEMFGFGPWEAMGLLSAFCSALAVTAIRAARRTEGSWSIYASFTLFGLLATLPFSAWSWKAPTAHEWFSLIGVGVFAMAAQLAMTHAFKWIETVVAGIVSQLAVIVAMILGALWLHETITPVRLVGSALTIGGVVFVAVMTTGRPVDDVS